MASGTISGGNYNNIYSYYMTWSSTSNGSAANTSNVTVNWIYKKNASDPYGAYNTSGSSKVTLTIGSNSSGAVRADFDLRSASTGTTKAIATYTVNNIPHNADGTLSLNVSGTHVTGNSWGTKSISSTSITLDTIPRYATCSQALSSRTETSLTVNWTSDSIIDKVWYSTNNGSSWTEVSGTPNNTSGSYTISSLSVGTTYQVKTRVRRKDSQLNTDSSKTDMATYSYPYIRTIGSSALTIGNQQTIYLYNPLGRTVTVYMKTGSSGTSGTQLYSGSTSNLTDVGFNFTPTASTMYNQIPNAKSGNCVYYVVYSGNTSAVKTGTYVVNESTNKPTVTSETPYDTNDFTYDLTNDRTKIILNASTLQLTIVANAKNNATFQNGGYIKVNGTSLTLTHSGSNATGVYTITKPSSNTFTITLQDSRGILSGDIAYSLSNYVNYSIPTMTLTAVRNQPTDGIINISGSGTFYNGSFGNSSNSLTATYTVTETSTSSVLESGLLTISTDGNNHTEAQKQVSNADYTKQYTVAVVLNDDLNFVNSIKTVPKGIPVFNWDNDEFDINVNSNIVGSVVLGSVKTKNILHNLTYDAIGQWGMSYALTNDRTLVVNSEGKAWAWVRYFLYNVPTGTPLTFSCNFTASGNANTSVTIYDNDGNELARSTNTTATSGNISLTFTTTTSTIKISFSANSSGSQITNTATFTNLMVERGSSATTYYPYQELNEVMPKNKNLFNYDAYDNQCSTMTKTSSINGFTINASQYANGSGIKLSTFCPQLEVGKTYFLSGTSTSTNSKYIYVGEVWNYGSSKTITQTMLDTNVSFYGIYPQGSGSGTITISNIQIEEGTSASSFTTYKGIGYVYGKNGNGKYIKYDDGTLIQWNRIEVNNQAINTAYGSLYQGTRYLTFPIPFVGNMPSCQCTEFQWGSGASWGTIANVTLTNITCRGIDITSRATGTNCRIGWFAIGRWK